MKYKHKVIGRINGVYGRELREETREAYDARDMSELTNHAAATSHMTFGRVNHRRGNP